MSTSARLPPTRKGRVTRGELVRLAVVAVFFLAAPTAGDIGSCNQKASDLDAAKFFGAKQTIDCQRCTECTELLDSPACQAACGQAVPLSFPTGCYPLVHDGEVCLNALQVASCDDYRFYILGYTGDPNATIPTECDFCPPRALEDAGTDQ
ncbi:Hypothetical protein A7982_03485 [Minicystis rosea]|nr:Hypothetical protein A7982_03485 [Minicystis rosea]